jgi:hypothetical protein
MSRELPTHPNLDHLKKQARRRLRDLQRHYPKSKLADAQHSIAREYGFSSWPELKARVELASAADVGGAGGGGTVSGSDTPPPNYGFERYSPKARQALFFSRYEAGHLGSRSIGPEHVLLGLIRAGEGLRSQIFERVPLSLGVARAELTAPASVQEPLSFQVQIPFGPETTRVLHYAVEEAERLKHGVVSLAHLLVGILRDEDSTAAAVLRTKGMRLQQVRDDIERLLNEEPQ